MREPLFLTLAEVIEVHADQISRYGGQGGVRDIGLLESALAQPEASFAGEWLHEDLHEMAAAYAYHVCQHHPFVDGNKRTALACALIFLELHGIAIHDPKGLLKDALLDITAGKTDKKAFARLLRRLTHKRK